MDITFSNIYSFRLKLSWIIIVALPREMIANELGVVLCTVGAMGINFTITEIM